MPFPSCFERRRAKGGVSIGRLDKRPIAIIRPKNDDGDAAKLKGLLCPFNFGPNRRVAYLAKILITEILISVGAGTLDTLLNASFS